MEKTQYNGPDMSRKKVFVLLSTALIIVIMFLVKTCAGSDEKHKEQEELVLNSIEYVEISPYDEIFRQNSDSLFDWKLLAAIAYVESKFDTSAVSHRGAMGLMQIMPRTYRYMLDKMGLPDTIVQNPELDVQVAVRYLNELNGSFNFINEEERINYILGGYNGGPNHIFDAMRLARNNGINRYNWQSLTPVLNSLKHESAYSDSVCKFGPFDATETLRYVRLVKSKYNEYKALDQMFREPGKLLETN